MHTLPTLFCFVALFIATTSFAQNDRSALALKIEAMAKVGACYSASFSPDGSEVAFISNMSGIPQLWKMSSSGGWPTQLTNFNDPVSNANWSPTGDRIAYQVAPGGGMNSQVYTIKSDGTDIQQVTSGGNSNNWFGIWSSDGTHLTYTSSENNPAGMDSYLYDVSAGKPVRMIKNEGIGSITDLSADKSKVLLSRLVSRGSDDMYLIDEDLKETLLTQHDGPGSFYGLFAPNGDIYMASNLDRDKIAFGKYDDGSISILAERDDAELQNFVIDHGGVHALLFWNVAGQNEVSLFDLKKSKVVKSIEMPVEQVGGGQFSADDRMFLFTGSGSREPANIWTYDMKSGAFNKLTNSPHPGVNLSELVAPELVKFKSFDGLEISGWLYKPSTGQAPYPTVISYHGGPEGQARPSFSYTNQALLSKGIAVLAPNIRGSSGFGKEFVNLDNGALRANGIRDIEGCHTFLVESGIADEDRIGIMGGSYGGYMVMAGITEYPDMFAAAANLFGVVNFITFFEETEPWMAAISKVEYGDPDTEAEMLKSLSPINKVDRAKTPTIVLHGANDTNVPVVEAEQVVDNFKARNVPVEYVLFADEGPGWRTTPNKVTSTVAIVEWFTKYLIEK